jgi:alpha-L-arabinofuranosidase
VVAVQTLAAKSLYDGNSAEDPLHLVPVASSARDENDHIQYVFPHESVTMLTLKRRQ